MAPINNFFNFIEIKLKNINTFIVRHGYKDFIKYKLMFKLINFFVYLFYLPISLIIVLIIRLISPLLLIRFIKVRSNRLGHFVIETEIYLCEKHIYNKNKRNFDIFFQEDHIVSNKYIKKIIKKKLFFINFFLGNQIFSINRIISGKKNKFTTSIIKNQDDTNNVFDKTDIQLKIPNEDIVKYKNDFEKMGLPYNSKYVCVVFRDGEYLKKNLKFTDWNYHNYRDANINTFDHAADYLISKGYYVVRVGRNVKNQMEYKNEKFIDYSCSKYCSDYMDALLAYKCNFFVTTGTGAEAFAYIFRKPLLFVNFTNIGLFRTFHTKHLHIFKHFYSKILKRNLNLEEIFAWGLAFAGEQNIYEKKNIELIDNSRDEIKKAVMDMVNNIENKYLLNKEDRNLQAVFWEKYEKYLINSNMRHKHGEKFNAKIGFNFLKDNSYLFKN
jgi:putative glycosyltransferase (TIGR04372 family)